jgi:hypothetical protein
VQESKDLELHAFYPISIMASPKSKAKVKAHLAYLILCTETLTYMHALIELRIYVYMPQTRAHVQANEHGLRGVA